MTTPVSTALDGVARRDAVERRLPGKARPAEEVLREYREFNAKRRERINSILWPFWAPDPDGFFRWRVKLDCGCITEVMTHGEDSPPDEQRWLDHVGRAWLPAGQSLCSHPDSPPAPYREIREWTSRREVSFPADPIEPPDWADEKSWAVLRREVPSTSAFWTVTLACGHVTEIVADLDWKPADGPHRVTAARQQEMTKEFEKFWATQPGGQSEREREHTKRMLVPRKPAPKPPTPPSRVALERQLRRVDAEAARLRERLAQLDTAEQAGVDGDR